MQGSIDPADARVIKTTAPELGRRLAFVLSLVCAASAAAHAQGAEKMLTEPETGVRFPAEVSFVRDGARYQLTATGTTVRTQFWFRIYSIAHYLEAGPKGTRAQVLARIMSADTAKQVTLEFARALDAEQVRDGFTESFVQHATQAEMRATRTALSDFLRAVYKDVAQGERFTVRWLPGGRLISMYDGKIVSEIHDQTFARVFWSVWFGDAPIVDRERLIARRVLQSGEFTDPASVAGTR